MSHLFFRKISMSMSSSKGLFIGLICASQVLMTACTVPMNASRDAAFQNRASVADRPVVRPVRSMSSFSDSLDCMDRLMRDAQVPTTLITSKQIPDFSTRVPVATKDMVITALLQMSRVSNAFRYVDYEVDIVRQDTVQNLTNILLNNNQMQLQRPSLYVSGAISFVDQNVIANRGQVGTSGSRLETGISQNRSATIVGLELHLGDFRTRTLIPGMDSANEVIIGSGGQGLDLAGRIGEYGWQLNVGRDYTLGSGAAVRTLVELALIELTGKWARVPYWQCLTLEQNHPGFQRQLRDWYDEGSSSVHNNLVRRSLLAKGYLTHAGEVEAINPLDFRDALARFQVDTGMPVTGVVDFPTYERALRDYVVLDESGRLSRYGWRSDAAQPPSAEKAGAARITRAGRYLDEKLPAPAIRLQIENILMGRTRFVVGEQVFLSAVVPFSGYLACYHANAQGSVIRVLPNAVSGDAYVLASHAVRLPDWMAPNPGYVIETVSPGTEGLLCMVTRDNVAALLPGLLGGAAFTRLPNIKGLDAVAAEFAKALPPQALSEGRVQWQVEQSVVVPPVAPASPVSPASPASPAPPSGSAAQPAQPVQPRQP